MKAYEQGAEAVEGCGWVWSTAPTGAPAWPVPTFVNKRGHENTLQPRWSPIDSLTGAGAQAVCTLSTFREGCWLRATVGAGGLDEDSGLGLCQPKPFGSPLLWSDMAVTNRSGTRRASRLGILKACDPCTGLRLASGQHISPQPPDTASD